MIFWAGQFFLGIVALAAAWIFGSLLGIAFAVVFSAVGVFAFLTAIGMMGTDLGWWDWL